MKFDELNKTSAKFDAILSGEISLSINNSTIQNGPFLSDVHCACNELSTNSIER